MEELEVERVALDDLICQSMHVLGNGVINDIHDIVVVDMHQFERTSSTQVAAEVSHINAKLVAANRPYVLIGVGRWGSLDPWLGIPVTWDQIAGASVIVESGFKDFNVTPSQGSHFFQNITSFRIGYFTISSLSNSGFIDWDWLRNQPAAEQMRFTRHLQFKKAIVAKINGRKSRGIILKPAE